MLNFLRMRWLFNRYVGWSIVWIVGLLLVAGIVNMVGIDMVGDIERWSIWLKAHTPIFLIWRIGLYCAVGYGWCWMRHRVIARETNDDAKQRFLRIEIGAVCALVALEVSNWIN